jgi:epoxide hydrolase-like predicted phosphatase
MAVRAVLFDLGGVIVRTEYQAPREHLAERLSLSYEELSRLVFESESARRASLGQIPAQQHWEVVAQRLGASAGDIPALRDEFFGGDVLDRDMLDLIQGLRPARKTGLISNAWLDLRDYIQRNSFEDAFDSIVISAEVGLVKPDAAIFRMALDRVGTAPEGAVMVDDFPENIAAAKALGMHGVLFHDPQVARMELGHLLG